MKYYKPNNSTLLYLNSSFNCTKSSSITLTKVLGGTGYTSAPTIAITPAAGDLGFGASATITQASGILGTLTTVSTGKGYNALPTVSLVGGGNPGKITGYSTLVGGSGYISEPSITTSGGGGTGFSAIGVIGNYVISPNSIKTNGGTGYITNDVLVFTGGGGTGATGNIVAVGGVITGTNLISAGTGYTSTPTVTVVSETGTGAIIDFVLKGSIIDIIITNGGKNYATAPSFVFSGGGGTGASATPTLTLGTEGTFTVAFTKTFTYTWNIPDIVINDLGKISAVNIVSTGYTATTPYIFRIMGLQYDSRDTFMSDYGNPILSIAQQTNICSIGSVGNSNYNIILTPQTIRQIQISVDDSITAKDTGALVAINFVIALEIEEYDPLLTQVGDPYTESASRLKLQY